MGGHGDETRRRCQAGARGVMEQIVALSRLLIKREGLDLGGDRYSVRADFDLLPYLPREKYVILLWVIKTTLWASEQPYGSQREGEPGEGD